MPLKRRCSEGECEFRGTDAEIESHLTKDCEFVKVACPNSDLCTFMSIRKVIDRHLILSDVILFPYYSENLLDRDS
jgi:hypothetical protein